MKDHSFYQYILTLRGSKNAEGVFAEAVFDDLMFPKQAQSYHDLSDYIENYGTTDMKLSVFDDLYESYEEWRRF
ncbi:YozE family protein [Macrococcus brunensis]|uniref:YozE family protein n=1 Tax=Macrococcus brunensis TaxID=198483 RepID=A0A4R6BCI8_9STAP|nr:YozE family protein [Macrococcus brunensis]TDL95578.1 YozE family protein [Macrococcus brunensis]ULG70976.1 YozE family protein [Macrococcus brunensis]ULG73313.1 YozE family protein [Macrococcus brunensis]